MIAISEDEYIKIYNLDSDKLFTLKSMNEVSIKYMCISKNKKFILICGIDGFLSVYKFIEEENQGKGSIQFTKKISAFEKTTLDSKIKTNIVLKCQTIM